MDTFYFATGVFLTVDVVTKAQKACENKGKMLMVA